MNNLDSDLEKVNEKDNKERLCHQICERVRNASEQDMKLALCFIDCLLGNE